MSAIRHLEVRPGDGDMRLDRFLRRRFPELKQGQLEKWLRTGQLRVDGRKVAASMRIAPGQQIRVPPLLTVTSAGPVRRETRPSDADVRFMRSLVIHDDGIVVGLDKPAGLAVQGGTRTTRHVDGLLPALDRDGERCRLVHRLDRDTGGLLLLGRGARAASHLTAAFKRGRVRKLYWALVRGKVKESQGLIDLPLLKAGVPGRERMVGSADGKPAKTLFRVVARAGRVATWLALSPQTGRTHQLRAHCAAIGHPIIGDHKYDEAPEREAGRPTGLMLLARAAAFTHPEGRAMQLAAPVSEPLKRGFEWLGFAADAGHAHPLEAFDP